MSQASKTPQIRYTRAGVTSGMREGVPIAFSIVPWGIAYGIAAQPLVSMSKALVMSAYVFSGTAQFVALGLWHHPIAIASLLLAVFAINARYLLQGMTLAPWLSPLPAWQRWGTLFFLSDGSWAASLKRFESGYDDVGHLLGSCVIVYAAWFFSCWLGLSLPVQHIDARAWGLDFAISAALIALAGGRWAGKKSVLPWMVAAATAWVAHRLLGGSWYMFVGGVAGAVAGAWNDERSGRAAGATQS